MTEAEITKRFKKCIDQYYAFPDERYVREKQMHHVGGILQAALHILPWEKYYELKVYCFTQHGYDPGGVTDGQMTINELINQE